MSSLWHPGVCLPFAFSKINYLKHSDPEKDPFSCTQKNTTSIHRSTTHAERRFALSAEQSTIDAHTQTHPRNASSNYINEAPIRHERRIAHIYDFPSLCALPSSQRRVFLMPVGLGWLMMLSRAA